MNFFIILCKKGLSYKGLDKELKKDLKVNNSLNAHFANIYKRNATSHGKGRKPIKKNNCS